MNVTHEFEAELLTRGLQERICAMQNDANTRSVKLTLLSGGTAWPVPAGTKASVVFRNLKDGHKGWYDTLPNGTAACTVSGNVVTAVLAPAVLSGAGEVKAAIVLQDGNLNRLATFGFSILVEPDPAAGTDLHNDYYAYSTMEAVSEAVDAMLESLEETKADIGQLISQVNTAVAQVQQEAGPAIVPTAAGAAIAVQDSSGRQLQGLTLYGKTTQAGTPTLDAPVELESVGAGGTIGASVTGKNLLPYPYINTTKTTNGITFTDNGDGSITCVGTATAQAFFNFSAIKWGDATLVNTATNTDGRICISLTGATAGITMTYYVNNLYTYIMVNTGVTCDCTVYPQLELGTTPTEYESPTAVQSLTAQTPNGLLGIPVSSGGNYTDESGQQWLCDEIDFARGVYIQRVRQLRLAFADMNNSEAYPGWKLEGTKNVILDDLGNYNTSIYNITPYLCNVVSGETGAMPYINSMSESYTSIFFNPSVFGGLTQTEIKTKYAGRDLVLFYAIKKRTVETALDTDTLTAYAALHSNKPNTSVLNDAGAGMGLRYVADTKTYIDNKFTELQSAIIAAGANV